MLTAVYDTNIRAMVINRVQIHIIPFSLTVLITVLFLNVAAHIKALPSDCCFLFFVPAHAHYQNIPNCF